MGGKDSLPLYSNSITGSQIFLFSGNNYKYSTNSFLFSLRNTEVLQSFQMNQGDADSAIYSHPSYGPTFGGNREQNRYYRKVKSERTMHAGRKKRNINVRYDFDDENENALGNCHDLYISDNSNVSRSSYCNFGKTYQFPADYDHGIYERGCYCFTPTEIEVFY